MNIYKSLDDLHNSINSKGPYKLELIEGYNNMRWYRVYQQVSFLNTIGYIVMVRI